MGNILCCVDDRQNYNRPGSSHHLNTEENSVSVKTLIKHQYNNDKDEVLITSIKHINNTYYRN